MVSVEEEEAQERTKPEQPKQLHVTLDANLSVQTRRRYLSSMTATIEDLRRKYWVMTHMWQLATMRQPSRPMYTDLDEKTWNIWRSSSTVKTSFSGVRLKDLVKWWVPTGTIVSSTSSS